MSLSPELVSMMTELALMEDIGSGDITAHLVPENETATAQVITREDMVVCGCDFVREVFNQVDADLNLELLVKDGDSVKANAVLFKVSGNARAILTGERNALNFLQMLSGTATVTKKYVDQIAGTGVNLLDTRKTIPLYRQAQKYAVTCGGGHNHRMGLYDAFLIKENHIAACGSITAAVQQAKTVADNPIEIEVESLDELEQAIKADADIVMLDNFSFEQMREAVELNHGRVDLEVSGNVTIEQLADIAATGVTYISTGAITKHVQAIDLSMRFIK